MKKCIKCSEIKSLNMFNKKASSKDGVRNDCKVCSKLYNKKHSIKYCKRKYNLSQVEYLEMVKNQNNTCAICKQSCTSCSRLSVDHCHKTGKVRGLLCRSCNSALGLFKDNISAIENSIRYLKGEL